MKFVQKTGQRKLTDEELAKVHRVKRKRHAWFLCSGCGHLAFHGSSSKYCIKCGYKSLEKVIVEEVKD